MKPVFYNLAVAMFAVLAVAGGGSAATADEPVPHFGAVHMGCGPLETQESATAEPATIGVPDAGIDARLQELYALYQDQPGFVDVYYHAGDVVEYRPLFLREVPASADHVVPPVPVAFDVLPEDPLPLGPGSTPDVNDLRCSGIRPGALLSGICTASFVFTDDAGVTYLGTAGHCFIDGAAVSIPGVGLIGSVVYSLAGGVGNDFALIEILAAKVALVSAEMCDWAGPTGTFTGAGGFNGRQTFQTGHGSGVGLPTIGGAPPPRPKTGVGFAWGATSFTWIGSSIPGDSGSAIRLDNGGALGTVTHLSLVAPVLNFGTRWDRGVDLVEADDPTITGLAVSTVAYTHP